MTQQLLQRYSVVENILENISERIRSHCLRHPFLSSVWLCLCSACLLVAAFPQADIWILSWVALVPFLFVLDGKKPAASFFIGYLLGILFFSGTLYWFIYVTKLGASLLVLYFGIYFALFGLGYSLFSGKSILAKIIFLPSFWVGLEFIRGHLFTGFGWVNLGHSQYKILPLIQISDTTGVFGISFLIVAANVLLKEWLDAKIEEADSVRKQRSLATGIISILLIAAIGYGFYRLSIKVSRGEVNVAVIQANTPQELKWQKSAWPSIMKTYLDLTQKAAKENPDIIIWPETAFPGFIWEAPQLFVELRSLVAQLKVPLLLGVVTQLDDAYYNSALLIDREGEVIVQHDKLHLVPFGEYVPLRKVFPFLSDIAPIGDFNAGNKFTLFPVSSGGSETKGPAGFFSVLICFEDTVPEISGGFVRTGANLLVNITNDAWFQDTKEPFLHMQDAVFRAVENRKYLIRAANTGVSCFIDSRGKVINRVENTDKKATYVSGYKIERVGLNNQKTFYTKYGDVFTYFCFGSILWGIAGIIRRRLF
ncbi:MAG TPA: apolipoprotein N-acyltransferase [Candidatus Omnitrophota bacterium]|nr:apolipoprotein N-acyltransferase [Candidatus Omnitrophota bacterium]